MKDTKRSPWIAIVLVILLIVCVICSLCVGGFALLASLDGGSASSTSVSPNRETFIYGKEGSDSRLLSIPISGVIYADQTLDGVSGGLFGGSSGTYGYQIKEQLREAAADENIDGIILEINSPGGTINGSQAIADGVQEYKDKAKKPVYVHISGLAASGGYFAAARADEIIADQGSLTGSIGVISGPFKYYDKVLAEGDGILGGSVVTQNGVEASYITAGGGKDVGNPYRRMTVEEIKNLQDGVNFEYENFVKIVSEARGISLSEVRNTIKAHIYDNGKATELKLIDQVGSREFAYDALAKKAGVEANYQVVRQVNQLSFLDAFFGIITGTNRPSAEAQKQTQESVVSQASGFYPGQILALYGHSELLKY